jgi:hypothetical protein
MRGQIEFRTLAPHYSYTYSIIYMCTTIPKMMSRKISLGRNRVRAEDYLMRERMGLR